MTGRAKETGLNGEHVSLNRSIGAAGGSKAAVKQRGEKDSTGPGANDREC